MRRGSARVILALILVITAMPLSACASSLVQLESDLEAALIAEDAELAEKILADPRWTNQRDFRRSQWGRALVADWKYSEELRSLASADPAGNCETYHVDLLEKFEEHYFAFASYEQRTTEYVNSFASRCGLFLFNSLEVALQDPSFVPGDGAFEVLDAYSWVDSQRATALGAAFDQRVDEIASVVQQEIDITVASFETSFDDFDGTTRMVHRTSMSGNGARFLFPIEVQSCSPRLSLEVEYRANTWLFMDDVEVKQGGQTVFERSGFIYGANYTGEVISSNASIKEKFVTYLSPSDQEVLVSLADDAPLAVRLAGETRNVDFSLESREIAALKETLRLYGLLGDLGSLKGEDCD